jgi:hypothetical protein
MTPEQMARDFHEAAGLTLPGAPTLDIGAEFVSDEVRQKILDEEVQELRDAIAAGDLVQIADALADIAYVVAGTAVTYGLPFDAILAEVLAIAERERDHIAGLVSEHIRVCHDGRLTCARPRSCGDCASLAAHLDRAQRQVELLTPDAGDAPDALLGMPP